MSRNRWAKTGDEYLAAGQTVALRVGGGTVKEATGAETWVPIADANGVALPGAVVITDANGMTSVDGRATVNLPAFGGTGYDRPEDIEIETLKNGRQLPYFVTTTNHKVFSIDKDDDDERRGRD